MVKEYRLFFFVLLWLVWKNLNNEVKDSEINIFEFRIDVECLDFEMFDKILVEINFLLEFGKLEVELKGVVLRRFKKLLFLFLCFLSISFCEGMNCVEGWSVEI